MRRRPIRARSSASHGACREPPQASRAAGGHASCSTSANADIPDNSVCFSRYSTIRSASFAPTPFSTCQQHRQRQHTCKHPPLNLTNTAQPVPHAHTASARTRTRARPHTRYTTAPHVASDCLQGLHIALVEQTKDCRGGVDALDRLVGRDRVYGRRRNSRRRRVCVHVLHRQASRRPTTWQSLRNSVLGWSAEHALVLWECACTGGSEAAQCRRADLPDSWRRTDGRELAE